MLIYEADKQQFLLDNDDRDIEEIILERYRSKLGKGVSGSEVRSWRESLSFMAKVLRDEEIPPDTGVAVELHLPQSSKRIDITLTGFDELGRKNAIIVELKQWDSVIESEKDGMVSTFVGGARREVVHPSYQAWSYAILLEGFNSAVYEGGIAIRPCAYLHNYQRDGRIDSEHYAPYVEKAPLFLKGELERNSLRSFIKRHVKRGDARGILYEIDGAKIRPSKALADALKGLMKGNPEFVLIDEQKFVYESALAAAKASSSDRPTVVIVEGGPGTGKTVLAINLLVALTNAGLLAKYVSKNAAPRDVYKSKLTGAVTRSRFDCLFSGSGTFYTALANEFDVLIVDEAHRLNAKSGLYGNLGENQIKELIAASKTTIFFIDEDQRVTMDDIGSKSEIERFAAEKSANVIHLELPSQFRCAGSDGYLAWLDNTLGVRETANDILMSNEYSFSVFDSPHELHKEIASKNANNKARVVAGYCWPWTSKNDPAAFDITIGDYKKRWNLSADRSLWIIAPGSIDEVGCVHTCQGLELDYVGVIVGPDLIVRDGKVLTRPDMRAKQDKTLKGYKKLSKEQPEVAQRKADLIIKNTYRTLMSRGMKGCCVFSEDEETRDYFRSRLQ